MLDDERPCRDTECDGIAEMEVDGTYRYFECPKCGFTFGYEQVVQTQESACAIGVPEPLRRLASAAMEDAQRPKMLPLTVVRSER